MAMKSNLLAIIIALGTTPLWAQDAAKIETKTIDYSINKSGSSYFFTQVKSYKLLPWKTSVKR